MLISRGVRNISVRNMKPARNWASPKMCGRTTSDGRHEDDVKDNPIPGFAVPRGQRRH
jgi:hypothetical protein